MRKRPAIKTTIEAAAEYWSKRIDECDLSVDWSEATTHCWRCGCKKNLQRCHIIPDALGGKDQPDNIVLLCSRCHAEGPNVKDPQIMWDWIRAYGVALYETFWDIMGMKEYKFIYQKSLDAEIQDILLSAGITEPDKCLKDMIQKSLKSVVQEASFHFGQPYFNAATMAGLYRMMLKDFARSLDVCFPPPETDKQELIRPWWVDV